RDIAEQRARQQQAESLMPSSRFNLDDIYSQMQEGGTKELPIVLKADTQGSLGAVQGSLAKLSERTDAAKITIVHTGTGAINESDVHLAVASRGIIIGFNVRPDPAAKRAADADNVDIRFYNVIYNLTDEVEAAMKGLLDPEKREATDGYAEVREIFRLPNRIVVAGLYVLDGKITRNSRVRVLRNGAVMSDTTVSSMKRFKDDVREVAAGYECGVSLDGYNELEEGDQLEFYRIEEVART
ncbi:MAG: translation initiation factor IF-2, partial [Chloroflexia bacterium]|nr:translation initiation factor IF-2 [Chloroflexia bacterium]